MKTWTATLVLVASLLPSVSMAQTTRTTSVPPATDPGMSPSASTAPRTGVVDRNTGPSAAAGDRNQAVATTSANAPQPARGANSFTEREARHRLESKGYAEVSGLQKDADGIWHGTAKKGGTTVKVWLDYKGNVGGAS